MDYPKRLIEVDLPIKRISAHARREKSIRHGHISTLHIWWARRPLAACRAVICAALWPDPADDKCPQAFRDEARRLMSDWAKNHLDLTSPESMSRFNRVKNDPKVLTDNVELRKAMLDFIADFANWDNATSSPHLSTSRNLTASAHESLGGEPGTQPLVADPFSGGGSIPLEAARLGADAFATDLNPIPVLLNTFTLTYIPRYGKTLAAMTREWGAWVAEKAAKDLAEFYPGDPDGATPLAYLWARTIRCEGPGCGVDVPLIKSLWLGRKPHNSWALRLVPDRKTSSVRIEVVNGVAPKDVGPGTVSRGAVTCPCCGYTTPSPSTRKQLLDRRGGTVDARMICVVTTRPGSKGRFYRQALPSDCDAVAKATKALQALVRSSASDALVPSEPTPPGGGRGAGRAFSQRKFGMNTFTDLFTSRQLLTLLTLVRWVREAGVQLRRKYDAGLAEAVHAALAMNVDKTADYGSSLATWSSPASQETVRGTFSRQALSITWDFAEAFPFAGSSGGWAHNLAYMTGPLEAEAVANLLPGRAQQASATNHPLPDDSADAFITDPPYYDAIPYADLSDFFMVWLKRSLADCDVGSAFRALSPKTEECVVDETKGHDAKFFEHTMNLAMAEGRRITKPSGVGVVVFAHKSTSGWETQLQAMIDAGWVITGSWPIDTEREGRTRANASAALASSVHLVCRPRENLDGTVTRDKVGEWRGVLAELPKRIRSWMPRLAEEGVVGADAIFACIGPALEVFSRYSRVEKASGEAVTLREYLEQVWAAVSTEALSMIFRDADAAGLESDARFTAIVLWTLGAGGTGSGESDDSDVEDAEDDDDEEESPKGKAAKSGYTLEYDAARKIAQGLGVNLEQIDSVVEVKGDKARLRPVGERAATLFGKAEKAEAAAKKRGKKATQKKLFDKESDEGGGKTETVTFGDGAAATPGVTALDRVHQAMLLFAGGRADALKRFIVEDGVGGDVRFWKLAQSLSALYPAGSDEKRWVDGVLARKKTLGF